MANMDTQTFEDFARELFAFEYCAECGGDWYDHEPWGVLGNWFAHCKVDTFCFIEDGLVERVVVTRTLSTALRR